MVKWRRQFVLEWNHIFRNAWLMGLPVLYGVLYAWSLSAVSPLNNLFNEAYGFHSLVHTLTLGITMLLGILAIRRDIRRPAYEWSNGLPLSYGTRIMTKYAAAMAYFTLFSLLAAVLFSIFSYGEIIEPGLTFSYSVYFFLSYEISYMVTLALAMLLAVCLPNRVVYLIGFCAWMFGTFFMQLFIMERYNLYVLGIFHLSQLFVEASRGYELWGYGVSIDDLKWSGLFVSVFAGLLLTTAVTILNLLRPTKRRVRLWATAGLAVLLACTAFVPYGLLWQERHSSLYDKINDDTILDINLIERKRSEVFEVAKYDLVLERTSHDGLTVVARLDIPALALQGKEAITLTLNRAFTVSDIESEGRSLSFNQQGDLLTVLWTGTPEQQADSVTLNIHYSGTVMEYDGRGGFYAFVHRGLVMLPSEFAWYPLPGKQHVYVKDVRSNRLYLGSMIKSISFSDAEYRLTVKGFDSILFTSLPELEGQGNDDLPYAAAGEKLQIFHGSGKDGISLYGGPFVEVNDSSLPGRIVTTPNSRKLAEHILKEWSGYYHYFDSWVTDFQPKIHQAGFFETGQALYDTVENGTYMLVSVNGGDRGYAGLLMNEMLLGTREGAYQIENTREDVRLLLRSLIWYVYYREAEGLSHTFIENGMADIRMLSSLVHSDSNKDPENLGGRMAAQVGGALDAGKIREVKEILNYFYSQGLEIPLGDSDESAKAGKEAKDVKDAEDAEDAKDAKDTKDAKDAKDAKDDKDAKGTKALPISYEDWEEEWERVMGHENGA